jgi:hypothetical protein
MHSSETQYTSSVMTKRIRGASVLTAFRAPQQRRRWN